MRSEFLQDDVITPTGVAHCEPFQGWRMPRGQLLYSFQKSASRQKRASVRLAGNAEFSPILWTRDEKDRLSVKGIELRRALPGSSSRVLS